MSDFCKFLCPITVDEDGWEFTTSKGSTTLPSSTYSTVLQLSSYLDDRLTAYLSGTWVASITSTGVFALSCTLSWTWSAASTNDDLKDALGLGSSDSVSGNVLTASNRHKWGWYPGVKSNGVGEGIANDTKWQPDDIDNIGVSGAGETCRVGPSRSPYNRTLYFDLLHSSEMEDRGRSPVDFMDRWRNLRNFRFYPDRANGTVLSEGIQMDPGHPNYEIDSDADYYICNLKKDGVVITPNDSNPDYWSVQLEMSCKKK